jgi:uncharacterized membrane protein
LLGFLLLLAPFYDSCNGERIHRIANSNTEDVVDSITVEKDSISTDSAEISKTEVDTINNLVENWEPTFIEKAYDIVDDDNSENAFEFAKLSADSILEFNFKDFKKDNKEKYEAIFFNLKNLCFLFIVIITFLIAVFSFKNSNRVYKLSSINLILLLITIICLFLEGLFETISQIKWGYYAFIITNALIFYYSKPNKIKT